MAANGIRVLAQVCPDYRENAVADSLIEANPGKVEIERTFGGTSDKVHIEERLEASPSAIEYLVKLHNNGCGGQRLAYMLFSNEGEAEGYRNKVSERAVNAFRSMEQAAKASMGLLEMELTKMKEDQESVLLGIHRPGLMKSVEVVMVGLKDDKSHRLVVGGPQGRTTKEESEKFGVDVTQAYNLRANDPDKIEGSLEAAFRLPSGLHIKEICVLPGSPVSAETLRQRDYIKATGLPVRALAKLVSRT